MDYRHISLSNNLSLTLPDRNCRLPWRREVENLVKTSIEETDKEEERTDDKKEEEVSLPPPPEKPEPGYCCGNDCFRCDWDVYYEELEEYNNKLSKEIKSILVNGLFFSRIVTGKVKQSSLMLRLGSLYELES